MPLQKPILCSTCRMVSYCTDKHMQQDESIHKGLCLAIRDIAKKRGKCLIHMFQNYQL